MPLKKRLAARSKHKYKATLVRLYGTSSPDHLPQSLDELPGSTLAAVRAALQHYWKDHGRPELGRTLAAKIESVPPKERFRVFPGDSGSKKFEDAARGYRLPRAAAIILTMLALAPRVYEMLMSKRTAFEAGLKTGYFIISEDVAKGGRARALPLLQIRPLIEQLLSFPAAQPHAKAARDDVEHTWATPSELLCSPGSSFVSAQHMLMRAIKEIAIDAQLATEGATTGWSPHMLRHIFTSRLTRAGCPHALIKFALGHEMKGTRDVTLNYVHLSPEDLIPYMPKVKPLKLQ